MARNVAALGAHVTLLGIVGDDEAADHVRLLAREAGVQADLITNARYPTTLKMRVLGRQQQLLRVDFEQHPAASALDALDALAAKYLAKHDIVVMSDYAKGALDRVPSLIARANAAKVPVLVDPKGDDYRRYRGAALITPNRLEMQQAVGRWYSEAELAERAQHLRTDMGLEALLVTRSQQGMTLFTAAGREHVEAHAHEVFDVSGAGDTVLATLAVTRAAGLPWSQAMYWANRAGGIVVGKLGTSVVTIAELKGDLP